MGKSKLLDFVGLKNKSRELRNKTLDICEAAGTGHLTSCFSCTEIITALYYGGILNYDSSNPNWDERDRFLLSKGQASPVLYCALADCGFYPNSWLDSFCMAGGKFGVHLQNDVPGVEMTSGSLGHGLGVGVGRALAAKMDSKPYFTFVLLGDGELQEGSNWESALLANQYSLNNLIAIVDRNWQNVTSFTEECTRLEPLEDKFKAFGWDATRIDGHSLEEILGALKNFRSRPRKNPYVILADTIKGKGSPYIESKILWHAVAPNKEQAKIIRKEINDLYRK